VSGHRATLSACMIAHDEEDRIAGALASLAFCDEIVVVDSGSTDRTRELAAAAGARVIGNPWPGFAAQRNVAIDHATGDWILEVDCDERVTEALRDDLLAFLRDPGAEFDIGALPRRNRLLGRWLGPAAKFPEYQFKLFRRGAHRHDEARTVHEGLVPDGPVWVAEGELEHFLADSWGELLRDWWRYAALESEMLTGTRPPAAYVKGIVLRPLQKLAFRLLVHAGWRDGWVGAVRIGFECASDSLVWLRALARRDAQAPAAADTGHFGIAGVRTGPIRLVALAAGDRAARAAAAWLRDGAAHGAETVLISDVRAPGLGATRLRLVDRLGPLSGLRALDAELQLRPADAVLAAGRVERAACRLASRSVLAGAPVVTFGTAPVSLTRAAAPAPPVVTA
jgi:Glycosyl transferase family 2